MGDVGAAVSAAIYAASNIVSWIEAKKMPKLQAAANKEVLELQKAHYDAISAEQRAILNAAVADYIASIDSLLAGTDIENAYPDVAVAAEYVPVDACCIQGATIECNISHTPRADEYVRNVNRLHEQNDLIHALSACPDFLVNLDIMNKSIQSLMRGILPVGDVVEVLTDISEQASLTGRIGAVRKTTARDLGISKMRAQVAGRKEFRETTAWANTAVSPLQRQHDITEMMQNPAQRIQHALAQAQLIQNSLQNKNNQLAQKAPYLMGKLQMRLQEVVTKLQYKAQQALLVNTHVPNYASIVFPKTTNFGQLIGGIGNAIEHANRSHFFGPPPGAQDGYSGSEVTPSNNNMWQSPGSVNNQESFT